MIWCFRLCPRTESNSSVVKENSVIYTAVSGIPHKPRLGQDALTSLSVCAVFEDSSDTDMALLSDQTISGMELLDLLLEQAAGNSPPEGHGGGHGNPGWPITDQSLPCQGEDADTHFLDSLLCVSECVSGPHSPLWAPSPCDSGISDDTPSDHLDSPPPAASPRLDSLLIPQLHHLPPLPQPQLQWEATSAIISAEPDVSIDVAAWESSLLTYRPLDSQSVSALVPSSDAPSVYELSVKDLLLSSLGEAPKQPCQSSSQELILNDDEKKLLAKEGLSLPNQLPLNKNEEKILKKIRRKIRNKQSAQESRKKKKEYIDGLEGRMAACSTQNLELQKKVIQLEKTNTSLLEQLRRLQAMVMNGSSKPGTCILVLLLSFSLILFPSLKPLSHSRVADPGDGNTVRVQSRSLRSVMEVHSLQPAYTIDRGLETPTSMITKIIRPEYADMGTLPHNRSYGDKEHYHGDPITGHMASSGWLSPPGPIMHHHKDRK